jgi:hypothetical protein
MSDFTGMLSYVIWDQGALIPWFFSRKVGMGGDE